MRQDRPGKFDGLAYGDRLSSGSLVGADLIGFGPIARPGDQQDRPERIANLSESDKISGAPIYFELFLVRYRGGTLLLASRNTLQRLRALPIALAIHARQRRLSGRSVYFAAHVARPGSRMRDADHALRLPLASLERVERKPFRLENHETDCARLAGGKQSEIEKFFRLPPNEFLAERQGFFRLAGKAIGRPGNGDDRYLLAICTAAYLRHPDITLGAFAQRELHLRVRGRCGGEDREMAARELGRKGAGYGRGVRGAE